MEPRGSAYVLLIGVLQAISNTILGAKMGNVALLSVHGGSRSMVDI